ncbi:MAG: hypothetical protein K5989_09035, partial [Lachnospiraceae bacterium]|nr:hypothetical protein [Lachnospiraceae bacterium]
VESVKAFERMFNSQNDRFVKVSFRMTVEDLIDSTMVQLYPIGFAVDMIEKFDDTKKRQSEAAMNKIW